MKAWSKIIAYKCLQGGSVSYDGILTSLGPKGLSEVRKEDRDIIINAFQQNPVLKEFNTLNKTLQDRKYLSKYILNEKLRVYHPTSTHPLFLSEDDISRQATFYATSNLCRIASQIVVGGENWVLMMALECIRKYQINVLPISYEYDGFLIMTQIDKCEFNLSQLNEKILILLKEAHLFPMNFEQKDC